MNDQEKLESVAELIVAAIREIDQMTSPLPDEYDNARLNGAYLALRHAHAIIVDEES